MCTCFGRRGVWAGTACIRAASKNKRRKNGGDAARQGKSGAHEMFLQPIRCTDAARLSSAPCQLMPDVVGLPLYLLAALDALGPVRALTRAVGLARSAPR